MGEKHLGAFLHWLFIPWRLGWSSQSKHKTQPGQWWLAMQAAQPCREMEAAYHGAPWLNSCLYSELRSPLKCTWWVIGELLRWHSCQLSPTQMLSGEFMSDNAKSVLECFEIGIDEMLDRSAMPVCTLCVYGSNASRHISTLSSEHVFRVLSWQYILRKTI